MSFSKEVGEIIISRVCDKSEIRRILDLFDEDFNPSLSSRIDFDEYVSKVCDRAYVYEAKLLDTLGFIIFYANNLESKTAYISQIAVKKEYKGSSLAQELLNLAIRISQDKGFTYLKLEVNKGNLRAINFYKNNKFVMLDSSSNKKNTSYMIKEI